MSRQLLGFETFEVEAEANRGKSAGSTDLGSVLGHILTNPDGINVLAISGEYPSKEMPFQDRSSCLWSAHYPGDPTSPVPAQQKPVDLR